MGLASASIDFPELAVILVRKGLEELAEKRMVRAGRDANRVNRGALEQVFPIDGCDDRRRLGDGPAGGLAVGEQVEYVGLEGQRRLERVVGVRRAAGRQIVDERDGL